MTLSLWSPDKQYPSGSGVYFIRCVANGRIYIGSSINLATRMSRHFTLLRGGRHENQKLQRHYDKYGEDAFECGLLESADGDLLDKVEQKWIDHYWPTKLLINLQRNAGRPPKFDELPTDVRERKRERHRLSSTGRPVSKKLIAILESRTGKSNPNYGTKWPSERVDAMRERMIGKRNPSAKACHIKLPSGEIKKFKTATDAAIFAGISIACASNYCHGKSSPRDGSIWEYTA